MKTKDKHKIDNKPVVLFCSAKTALELKDIMPADEAVNTLIATTLADDDECYMVSVHDFKDFLNKCGEKIKRGSKL